MDPPRFYKKPKLQCQHCLQIFTRPCRLANHQSRRKIRCSHCSKNFCNDETYQRHLRTIKEPVPEIEDLSQKIQPETAYGSDAGYQVYLLGKIDEITDWVKRGTNYTIVNKAINPNFTYKNLYSWLTTIYTNCKTAFKISLGFGFVLFNPISKEYRYFYVSDNNSLFEKAFTVASKKDLERLMKKIIALDLTTNCYLSKPSSGWVLCSITNVQAKITYLPGTLIGSGTLPSYIQKSKSIIGLTHLKGVPYEDKLCAYRCIALHQGLPKNGLERYTKHLLREFEDFRGKKCDGISVYDIPLLEICFKIAINVYSLNEDGSVDVIYLTTKTGTPLYMNLYEKHFSYISKINSYSKNFRCSECDRIFDRPDPLKRHIFRPLKDDYFTTFSKRHSHIFKELRGGIVGGPSIVFNRYQERGVTKIKGDQICRNVFGFDCNAMYLECIGEEQCTGPYCLREKRLDFKKHSRRNRHFILYSEKAMNWIESIERERGIRIRTAESNPHGEKRIGNCYVDGYYNNTIFEFLGCYFHGHDCNPKNRLDEWEPTQKRLQKFRDMGYKVETILECEWNQNKRATPGSMKATLEDMIQGVSSGEIFGLMKCSLHVPPEKIDYFSDFPPIFKNVKIDLEDIGPHMQEYAKSIGRKKGVEKCLISSMFGNNIVILSTLFNRYLDLGLVCTDIEWVLEYNRKPVFKWFADKVSNDRRRADLDPDLAIIGETSKTCGNASYGYCAMDKTKHNNVLFCKQDKVAKHLRDPFFKSMEQLDGGPDGIYEIVKAKRKIVQDNPIQVAIAVYSRAKMLLLDFWVFLKEHLDDSTYCLMETDTDSLYIAISKDTIDECVRPDKLDDWKKRKYEYFASDSEELVTFEGKKISKKQYDKRTPGKFKLEFSGIGMICLNSKVYHIWADDGEFKTSSKGMQSRNKITKEDFLDVMLHKLDHKVQNAGFIDDGLRKITYTQDKKGLNYFYCKRIILEDGISTTHLNI